MNEAAAYVLLVVIYLRVSTEKQAKKGYSLPEQREMCRAKAKEIAKEAEEGLGHPVELKIVEFVDDFGGDIADRPVLEEVRTFVREQKPNYFICLDPDRFSRSMKLQLIVADEIEAQGTHLVFVQQDYDPDDMNSRAFFQFRGIMAELEKAKIIERITRGKHGKLKSGKRANLACPYGYKVNKETKELEIYEPEAKWVRQMFHWVVNEDMSYYQVAARMNALGVPTKRGVGKWYRSVVRDLLENTTYIGKQRCNRRDARGLSAIQRLPREKRGPLTQKERPESEWIIIPAPRIIDDEIFYEAQERLSNTVKRGGRRNGYLLSMLCRCSLCGGRMAYMNNSKHVYLFCPHRYAQFYDYAPGTSICSMPYQRAEKIEMAVWIKLVEWLANPDLLEEYLRREKKVDTSATRSTLEEQVSLLQAQLASKKKEQVDIVKKQFAHLLTEDVANQLLKEVVSQIEEIEAALSDAQKELERLKNDNASKTVEQFKDVASTIAVAETDLRSRLANMSFDLRRQLILKLVKKIIIYPDGAFSIITY